MGREKGWEQTEQLVTFKSINNDRFLDHGDSRHCEELLHAWCIQKMDTKILLMDTMWEVRKSCCKLIREKMTLSAGKK